MSYASATNRTIGLAALLLGALVITTLAISSDTTERGGWACECCAGEQP